MSAWLFDAVLTLGEITIEAFLNPSLYADLPSGSLNFSWEGNKPKEGTIRQTISRMEKHGFLKKEKKKYLFTESGRKLAEYILRRKKVFDKKWDGKYRVVIFDIPEKKRKTRDWLRNELYALRYQKLQESVFIGKFPLTKDMIKEINNKKLKKFVDYMLVEKVYSKLND